MTIEEICNKYIKVKATGILALHQHPKQDWAFKVVLGKESDVCNGCFLEKYYPLRLPYTCAAQQREDGKNVQFKEISKTMTREEAKEMLPIIQAWADGKIIQVREKGRWVELCIDDFNRSPDMYRIKPEPKYRPFKNQEECWQEMLKHQPFGWLKSIRKQEKIHIGRVFEVDDDVLITLSINEGINNNSNYFFNEYTFADGTPFGIKEE